ncbi:MAG TPA: penicillin-binding protein 2 [Burkholderiaceae bacterium]|nr:penicillin-binding protein 2 [Burkholderiaceae bacterium]
MLAVKLPAWRSRMLLFGLFCGFVALAGRAFYLQGGVSTQFLQRQGEARYARTVDVAPTRGAITDRNGVVLASSVPARAIWAIPDDVDAGKRDLAQLAQLLDVPASELRRRLSADDRSFVYLKRQVAPEIAKQIESFNLSGIHSTREFRRLYPEGAITAQLLGFTDVEDRGQDGIELSFERTLGGRPGLRRLIKDRLGRAVEDDWVREPIEGRDVRLSIDHRIQYLAYSALRAAVEANQAQGGSIVVLDVASGGILALTSWPSFDPARRDRMEPDHLRNRAVTDTFEPGSTIKPFSIATALEAGVVTPQSTVDTSPGWTRIGGRTITDTSSHGVLTVEQVVAKSSNVGTAKIALQLPAQTLWDTLTAVGFGQAPHAGLTGAVTGRLRPPDSWRPIEQATIAYGYGVSVSLLQLARAYLVFARDGDIVPVSVMEAEAPVPAVRVLQPQTARAVRRMLELAVSEEGTAASAHVPGYQVAGKTGTARKLRDGRYTDAYVASFVGFAPASNARVVIAVMIDDPRAGRYYGADVAAPVFSQVAAGALRELQVAPQAQALALAAGDSAHSAR